MTYSATDRGTRLEVDQIDVTFAYHAIILTTWSIYFLGVLYVLLLILSTPS